MQGKKVNSTFSALFVLIILVGLAFIMLRGAEALRDTYDYGENSVQDIKKLEHALDRVSKEAH